ncbi:cation:proton antiporter [Plasticicumulans acidivorans]|uniref:Sodium/proton antiporter NhaS3 (CPA2 family) n=1 Tax=Plasticicumulans acidivorans TaxID=886464 RepID=A0A317N1C8_9GAMM|nr:cation:proton antiporter [Plasticicumulans acidivorans]PWV65934.1 sodium/proton antiporter NhaS3 (CPA2 family) [Plasticicumulans acidivorans]
MKPQPPRGFRGPSLLIGLLLTLVSMPSFAGGDAHTANVFFWTALMLLAGKIGGLVERWKQPPVLGELLAGVLLGNLVLFGFDGLEPVKQDPIEGFLAQLGVVILLFQVGLESNVATMRRVGVAAFLVACAGVAAPFALGTLVVGPLLFPNLSWNGWLFLGATLTATSVGITGRVFRDMGQLHTTEAQIILGAAVIDDVIGLVILAVVSAIISTGAVDLLSVLWIVVKAVLFLGGAIALGQYSARALGRVFSRIHTGSGMKVTLAISFCLLLSALAYLIGLAPIVGAFAAGLVLDDVAFEDFADPEINGLIRSAVNDADAKTRENVEHVLLEHRQHHLDALVAPLGHFVVPLFFVYTGMQVNLSTLFDPHALLLALAVTVIAFGGKLVSGLVAGPVDKWLVGWGMAPRGEVGLIFAIVGKQLGVVSAEEFSVIVLVVILTTLLTPLILGQLLRRKAAAASTAA